MYSSPSQPLDGGHGHSHSTNNNRRHNRNQDHSSHQRLNEQEETFNNEQGDRLAPSPDSTLSDRPSTALDRKKDGKQVNRIVPTSSAQMNMRGVFLHVMADALGSVIVCISATIIYFTDWWIKDYVDPLLSIVMVSIISITTWPLLHESAMILLQTVPTHIQIDSLRDKLLQEVSCGKLVTEYMTIINLGYTLLCFFPKLANHACLLLKGIGFFTISCRFLRV